MGNNNKLMEIPNLINGFDKILDEAIFRAMDLAVEPIDKLDKEIYRMPDERDQLIKNVRSFWNQRYKELIESGLKVEAEKGQATDKISQWMLDNDSYKIPFPEGCQATDQNIEPKEWIIQAVAPIFEAYHVIKLCNSMLTEEIQETATMQKERTEALTPPPGEAKPETITSKIESILKEPLRGAFDNDKHIDAIIEGFVYYLIEGDVPKNTKKAALRKMKLKEFLKPFRLLYEDNVLQREEISRLLLYYIEKPITGEPGYSQAYINRILSENKSKLQR